MPRERSRSSVAAKDETKCDASSNGTDSTLGMRDAAAGMGSATRTRTAARAVIRANTVGAKTNRSSVTRLWRSDGAFAAASPVLPPAGGLDLVSSLMSEDWT